MNAAVSVSVTVPLSPEAAFQMFTEEVDRWWKQGPVYRFRARRGCTMRFEGGAGGRLVESYGDDGEDREIGRIVAWEPGKRLAIEWREPGLRQPVVTDVEVLFTAVPAGTRVTVNHSAMDRIAPEHPARHGLAEGPFLIMRARWWQAQLDSLRHLAG